jgi:hypothetical protein
MLTPNFKDAPRMCIDSRVPPQIRPLLDEYICALDKELPGFVTGLYLHGSIALDAFNEDLSDVDFIAFIHRLTTDDDFEKLTKIHQEIASRYPRWALEGSYLQWDNLGKLEDTTAPSPVHHDGKLERAQKFEVNSVTWWVLKNRGITLTGPPSETLDLDVNWDLLITRMKRNLNTYWAGFTKKPELIAWLYSDYGVQWVVLGVLRQYYSFVEGDITSKTGAGEYALTHLPSRWHRVIREAIRIRAQEHPSLYKSRLVRAVDAYLFLKYVICTSNALP